MEEFDHEFKKKYLENETNGLPLAPVDYRRLTFAFQQ